MIFAGASGASKLEEDDDGKVGTDVLGMPAVGGGVGVSLFGIGTVKGMSSLAEVLERDDMMEAIF